MAKFEYRKGLPERPKNIARLPVDERGYPVPFFGTIVNGVPDFRIVDHAKIVKATLDQKCFVCGSKLGQHLHFAMGPRSGLLMKTNHGPAHKECIEYSLNTCPFILYPNAQRRQAALPDIPLSYDRAMQPARPPIYVVAHVPAKNVKITHNPESLVCTWDMIDYRFWRDDGWITPAIAESYIVEECKRYQAELLGIDKPAEWSQAVMDKWLQDSQQEAEQKLSRLLAWIAEQR
jgi:hypothetical protein